MLKQTGGLTARPYAHSLHCMLTWGKKSMAYFFQISTLFLARLSIRKKAGFIFESRFILWRCATPLDPDRHDRDGHDGHHENRKTDPLFDLLSHTGS